MSEAILLKLHLFGVAFWFGVVGVEFIVERQRAASREQGFLVARVHERIDLFLEMPAFVLVLITGVLMVDTDRLTGFYLLKVSAGAVAVLGNVVCLAPVFARKSAADRQDLSAVIRYSAAIDRITMVALPAGLLAFCLGVALLLNVIQ